MRLSVLSILNNLIISSLFFAVSVNLLAQELKTFEGHAYEVISTPMSWMAADEFAKSKGGALVKIDSFQENFFIENLMSSVETSASDGGGSNYFWLGANDISQEGDWTWSNGGKLNEVSVSGRPLWGNGQGHGAGYSEPDNFNGMQDCLAMGVTGWPKSNPGFYGAAGQWNDLNCGNLLSFAIEYTLDASFGNNILRIENIKVGEQTYWASLVLQECETICFKIIEAEGTNYPATKTFSEFAENVLKIERVNVGDSAYYVELELINSSDLIFQLKAGSLTRSLTYVPADSDTWIKAEPEEVGLKSSEIQKAIDYAFAEGQNTQGLLILRHGAIVAERYATGSDKDSIATSWSMAKSFVSALTGIAIDKGFISSVDVPVADYVTEWAGDDRKNITLRDLLLMSSGLYENGDDGLVMYVGLQDSDGNYILDSNGNYQKVNNLQYSINRTVNPSRARWLGAGYTWNYSNADTQIIGHIIESASNKFINSFAEEYLFSKIGISADWWTDGFHNYMHYCCLDMTTRDFAKFGLLFARDGKWGSERVIPEDWVLESTAPIITITESWQIGYGYQWWPDKSGDWYYAVGTRSQLIYVHPGLDIVVVRNGTVEFVGDTKHRRGDSYHLTQFPANWNNVEFFQHILDSAKIN